MSTSKIQVSSEPIPIFTNFSEVKPTSNRRISFNEEVHVFDMSKPPPKSPRQSKIITPILKQSPNVSSDEEESQIGTPKSMKNSGNQNKAFLDEVINELKHHQQKINNDLVTIPLSPKHEDEKKSYGHRRSPSSHDFFKSHQNIVDDQVLNLTDKFQVLIDITGCMQKDLQIKAKENVIKVEGKILEAKKDGTNVTINFCKRFNLPNQCDMKDITSNISNNQLVITAPKTVNKSRFRAVPILLSEEKNTAAGTEKKKSNEEIIEKNDRLGKKLKNLGRKYSEIEEAEHENPVKNDRFFGIRYGQNMRPVEMPGFDFSVKSDFNDDAFENNFKNEFDASKWGHTQINQKLNNNVKSKVTNVPIVVEEKTKPKFGSCHSPDADFGELKEGQNGRFFIEPSAKNEGKIFGNGHVQRAYLKNDDLDDNIVSASRWASANHPWFQNPFGNEFELNTTRIS